MFYSAGISRTSSLGSSSSRNPERPALRRWAGEVGYIIEALQQVLMQAPVPNTQWGQTNGNDEFGAEADLLKGPTRKYMAHALKTLQFPAGLWQNTFKSQVRDGGWRVYDQLVHNSLIDWWWENQVVSQGLTLSVLSLQEAWDYVLIIIK